MAGRAARMCADPEGDSLFEDMKGRCEEWDPVGPTEAVEAGEGAYGQD